MPKTTDLRPGLAIGRYLLEAPIGEGGFGAVWRARSLAQPGKRFALKFALDPSYVRFLKKEGVLQLSLDHPSIVKMQEVHTEHDPPFVVMEYIEGHSLRHKLSEKGPLSIGDAENLLFHLLEVLEYTHARGVTHRDLKPENILIESKTGRIKLTDFGLGQTRGRYLSDLIVSKGLLSGSASAIAGTFAYQAPEARRREDSVDHRADLYALGVVLFEVLTGRIPAGLELPSELRRGVPRRLDRVFRLAYTANPEQRVPDARRMREAMTRTRGEKLAPILAAAVLAAPVLGLALSLYARTAPSPGGPPPASLVVHAAGPFGATAAASSAEPAPPSSASPSAAVASRSPVAAAPTPPRA
ncbi:MAG: serine/threonine-protein kinase, partial [Planctomycetota bacterium]